MNAEQVLLNWRADEQAVRARLRPPGASRPTKQLRGLSGMEVFEAIFAGELPVHSMLPANRGYTTLELKINLVRPLTDQVPLVRAESTLIHAGRQVATAEGRIVGPDGKLSAHATTTCLIFDYPAEAAARSGAPS